jgi:DNA-binding NtrC family response regulator
VSLAAEDSFGPLLGKSAAMRALFAVLKRVAPTSTTVLIEGESGTGKELIAEAIHAASNRAEGPFTVFDCAATPANLVESELFGYERGAFTGADARRIGRLEEAEGGTIFFDEIGELPPEIQPKLLRALESREFRRLGAEKSQRADVRVVAATNRDLAQEVNRGTFRHDLYYRLAVVRVEVPPLRDRADDLPLLVEHFARRVLEGDEASVARLLARVPTSGWQRLAAHAWRGNVRELRNVVERSLAMADPGGTEPIDLLVGSAAEAQARDLGVGTLSGGSASFHDSKRDVLAAFERDYFQRIYEDCRGNISEISRRSGLERTHVRAYLRRHGIGGR